MKSFKHYLVESIREYKFRVYFSGKPATDIQDHVKASLGAYNVKSMTEIKSLPLTKSHGMFPTQTTPEVYMMDVTCEYPATAYQIQVALTQLTLDKANVSVENLDHAEDVARQDQAVADNTSDVPLLMQGYAKSKIKAKDWYGTEYNDNLVKNSVTGAGKTKIPGGSKPATTTNDLAVGKKSPVGSNKVKLPTADSIKR